jgi:O-methyltransferase involved in polyketide biosynthesis
MRPAKNHQKRWDKKLRFVRVLVNTPKEKKALYYSPDTEQYYLYSFVDNEFANESMVFLSDEDGEMVDSNDLASEKGYVHSQTLIDQVLQKPLSHEGHVLKWNGMHKYNTPKPERKRRKKQRVKSAMTAFDPMKELAKLTVKTNYALEA